MDLPQFVGLGEPLGKVLDAAENASPARAVEAVTRELQSLLGATTVSFLIADLSGRGLVRLGAPRSVEDVASSPPSSEERAAPPPKSLPYNGGPEEVAMRTQTVQVKPPRQPLSGESPSRDWTVLAPVTERGEALGLLEMCIPSEPDAQALAEIARVAHVLAFVIIANGRHTDLFESGQRQETFSLPAEIQRRLLPSSFTCEAGSFTLAGWLEPAAHIGGDTFDYSLELDALHLSITDAMGHGVGSSLIATLCVGSLRNSRRRGIGLLEQALAANDALRSHGSLINDGFATGQLGRVDLRTNVLSLVNAGHVLPYLCRSDEIVALELPADLPLGTFADAAFRVTELTLQEQDRVVFITDGMLERNVKDLDLVSAIGETTHLHPREATRTLADRVLESAGGPLGDDATLMMLDWHGTYEDRRTTEAGANLETS
jgi:serine phosphatase RsbU (regulator of sigma subunit)